MQICDSHEGPDVALESGDDCPACELEKVVEKLQERVQELEEDLEQWKTTPEHPIEVVEFLNLHPVEVQWFRRTMGCGGMEWLYVERETVGKLRTLAVAHPELYRHLAEMIRMADPGAEPGEDPTTPDARLARLERTVLGLQQTLQQTLQALEGRHADRTE